jgi:GAF domain-containing protein
MGRGAKSAKAKVEARPPVARKSRKVEGSTGRQVEQRLAEALEQQAATSEVLHAISSSPTDLDPVFRMILVNATRLCGASVATLWLFDGEVLTSVANQNASPAFAKYLARARIRPGRETTTRRAALERKTIHVADLLSDPDFSPPEFQRKEKVKTVLSVPLLRQDTLVGVVTLWRREIRPFTNRQVALVETFADQAVIAIENVRLFNETKEALDQQTATAQILQAISGSPGALQPVLDTVVRAAAQFCAAPDVLIMRLNRGVLRGAAAVGPFADVLKHGAGSLEAIEIPVTKGTVAGRSVAECRSIHVHDLAAEREDEYPEGRELQRRFGHRTLVATPLLREGVPLGVIVLFRTEVKPFSDKQIALLQTFADQAVIAIENVRLFHELETRNRDLTEALEQQTATSDILRVISRSQTDVQPVFDTIAKAALELCRASSANVFTYDGELVHLAAFVNVDPAYIEALRTFYPRPPSRDTAILRAIQTRSVTVIPDVLEDKDYVPVIGARATAGRFRSILAVPLMREGKAIGGIAVGRAEPGLFPDAQIALLKTFADQAVIAIENVRLFKELESRNRDLTEALEQQTATSDILRVISQSPTDVQPVFDTIAAAALKLCQANSAVVTTFDGELLRLAAVANVSPEGANAVRHRYPRPPGRGNAASRAVLTRSVVAIPDVLEEPEYDIKAPLVEAGFRSVLAVPLMREENPIGAITVVRPEPGLFPDKQIALLQTFADQAVIAIENVRLFTELEARNSELRVALEHQTATSELLRVIGRSAFDLQPVFETLAENAARLCAAERALIFRFDGQLLRFAVGHNVSPELREFFDQHPIAPGRGTNSGRAALERLTVHNLDVLADPEYSYGATKVDPYRTVLAVPMLKGNDLLGVICIYRQEVRAFTASQIALMETFADQAVIAIENVRLFNETKEALERQTATAEILKVISSSPTDVQPVFGAIAERAAALCEAEFGFVTTYDGDVIHYGASVGPSPEALEVHRAGYPMKPGTGSVTARVVLQGVPVQIEDMFADPEYSQKIAAERGGFRSGMGVPMVREGNVIGAIVVVRTVPGKFSERHVGLLQTFADQAVIAIENVRLFKELETRNRDVTEALEQQTATSDILRVISRSQRDVQPVFDTIAAAALKLCRANSAAVMTFDGELIHLVATVSVNPEGANLVRSIFPRPPSRDMAATRAILTRSVVAIPDVLEDPDFSVKPVALATGFRSALSVPLMRDGSPIGAITAGRPEPGPFPDKQIALLQTFADQAVIAIENVRLFKELEHRNRDLTEALEQQTATSDILRVISRSQTDVQPVFDTIAGAAQKLCNASSGLVFTFDGKLIHLAAIANLDPAGADAWRNAFPRPPSRATASTRAVLTRSIVAIPDVLKDPDYVIGPAAASSGFRSALAVPLLREGNPIGVVGVGRTEPGPFPDKQIALLQTFADQAVIAIENVRLFNETKEALERQTATAEVLKVISESPTDVQPVFDAIAERAKTLCGAYTGAVTQFDGELVHLRAFHGASREAEEEMHALYPMKLGRGAGSTRAIIERAPVQIADIFEDPDYSLKNAARTAGFRNLLAVPMLREGEVIGSIVVSRTQPGVFAEKLVSLLQTFADQAVIAIENVRLFKELQARTAELTKSVGELRALGEVGQAVSSTLDLETVLRTIVSRATTLAGMDGGAIYEYDETREEFYLHTADRLPNELVEALRVAPIRKGEGALGRMAVTGEPTQIGDIADEASYQSRLREMLIRLGYRSLLAVPLLREDHLLGGLVVNRKSAGEFTPQVIDLLKTFATQSALAIQNARLFREIEEKSRLLETASRHKSEFLANMSHELRTPLNAIIGFSEVLSERMFGEINDKQAEYLSDILESGRHLLSLINDILDLSKIEAGRMELEPSEFDLPSAIENTLILVRERAQRRGITLGRTVDERLAMIRADERKVKQVLLNLLSNALKFTPEGGQIDVRARVHNGEAEISVADTGVGIAPEDQEAVFEEFRQVGTTARKVEGTGLGLAISRKFIELHGGRIWVKSQPGMGSTFAFTLPLTIDQRHPTG